MPIIPITKVNEGSSSQITFKLVSTAGTGIAVSNIATALATLRLKRTGAIINSRENVDVKSSFDGSGNFSYILNKNDNDVIDANLYLDKDGTETHVFHLDITVDSGSNKLFLNEEIWLQIVSLTQVT